MGNKRITARIAPLTYIVFAFCIVLLPLRWIVAWLSAVVIHEIGHIVACRLCGAKIYGIEITPYGMKIETGELTFGKRFIALVAGPLAGFVMMLFAKWLPLIAMFSAIHSAFNLLPIVNLDGYHALRCIICLRANPMKADSVCRIADIVSRVVLCCLVSLMSWKLCWPAGIVFCILLFVRQKRNPCKQGILQVQ